MNIGIKIAFEFCTLYRYALKRLLSIIPVTYHHPRHKCDRPRHISEGGREKEREGREGERVTMSGEKGDHECREG